MLIKDKIKLWRKKFYGRQEVFGTKVTYFSPVSNKELTHYVAMFQDQYKTKEAREGVTADNTAVGQLYVPLGDDYVEGHIKGYQELLIYVLQTDNFCKFAALDFDSNHTFDDVMSCYEMISVAHQIPCYIARSTSKGHHLYMFFDKAIEARYVTSYINFVYEELGFMEMHRNGVKHLPETFPKTIVLRDPLATGYGIKPPMQGKGMGRDMNCWIKAEEGKDEPIGGSGNSDAQWEYLQNTKEIGLAHFKNLLKKAEIPIEDIRLSDKRGVVYEHQHKRTAPYKPPKEGELNRIIQGCPAMKRYWEGLEKDFPHMARVALVTWAMQTKNGLDMLRSRWKGSAESEKHILYQIENYQQPWSCRAMQQHDLCVKGKDPKFVGTAQDIYGNKIADHCFKKATPKEIINGKVVVNSRNLPESEWADPSPVRLRVEIRKINVKDLKSEIDKLDKDNPKMGEMLTSIYEKVLMLSDKRKRSEVEQYLKNQKLAKPKELKEIAKEAKENRKMATEVALANSDGTMTLNGTRYAISERTGGYVIVDVDAEGNRVERDLCNFQIELLRDVHLHSLIKEDLQNFTGHIIVGTKKLKFKINTDDWATNVKLAQAIVRCGKTEAVIPNYNLDHLRAAVHLFGRYSLKSEHRYEDYGFDCYENPQIYRSASWNITSEGFSGEKDSYVDLSNGDYAQYLKLDKITNDDFAKAVNHIKNDLLTFQDPKLTYTTVAHTLQATIQQAYLPFPEAPVLWIQGLTGSGKSALAKFAQDFHGSFPRLLNVGGTSKAIEFYSMLFKDALLVLDDYKEAFYRKGTMTLVQNIYDRSARARLKQNLDQAKAPFCRGLLMITSEDRPSSEASTLARCIYIEAPQIVTSEMDENAESTQKFRNLLDVKKLLSGVTGRFIHYVISTCSDREELKKKYYEYFNVLVRPISKQQNGNRAAQNLAANYLVWELFCNFLKDNQMLTKEEYTQYMETHWRNVEELRNEIVIACHREQASNVFLDVLRESVMSGRMRIEGMDNNTNDNVPAVGFITDYKDYTVYVYPNSAVAEVKRVMVAKGAPLSHSQEAIGKQLQQDGFIVMSETGRTGIRKLYRGNRSYVWAIDSKRAGLGPQDPSPSDQDEDDNVVDLATFGR